MLGAMLGCVGLVHPRGRGKPRPHLTSHLGQLAA